MKKILQSYLRRLTNLAGNNRSLVLLRLISDQFVDIHDFNFLLNKPSFHIINGYLEGESTAPLTDHLDSRDKDANVIGKKLKKLNRIENFIFQERGARDLYIGWPFVEGKFNDDTLVRCPLIFFPVELELKSNRWILNRRMDVNITFNKSFLLAYSFYNQVKLDEELLETVFDDFGDATVFKTQLYELLKSSQIELNFNQELFMDELISFKNYKKVEFEKQYKTGTLKLFPEAVVGIFPQAGSYLVPDYVHLVENTQTEDLETFFSQRVKKDPEDEGVTRFSDRVMEENTFTPFPLDTYQEQAINFIKKGNSVVVQGPPGTGKSQLISNLICDYIARGKNVLLVCQKRAALDVVYNRLKEKELHDFIGLVHDFKNDRKTIFNQISDQIERIDEYKQKNNSLDSIQLERSFLQASRKIDNIIEELEEFKQALYDENECGKSVKELYLSSDPEKSSIYLKQSYRHFHYDQLPEFKSKFDQYLLYRAKFEGKNHFWADQEKFANYETSDLRRIKDAIKNLTDFYQELEDNCVKEFGAEMDYETSKIFLNKMEDLDRFISNLDNDRTYQYFIHMMKEIPDEDHGWLSEQERVMMQCFKGSGPEITLKHGELGRFQESLEHAIKASKGLFSWLRWRLFSKDKIFITRILVSNGLKSNKEGFRILLDRIDNRLNYEHNISIINDKKWLSEFPENYRKIDIQNWFFYQKLAFKSYLLFKELRSLDVFISFHNNSRKEQIESLEKFKNLLLKVRSKELEWISYLSEQQIRLILNKKVEVANVLKSLNKDFDSICEYQSIRKSFSTDEIEVLHDLNSNHEIKDKWDCFLNSLALSWIEHIEEKYPVLRTASTNRMDHLTDELQDAIDQKMKASTDILLLKSREKTYEKLEYNRLNNMVTYRDLLHQTTKKRLIWPIRRVISNHHEELFKILPCWMASPESASAIFPMEESFDLVIFDEASQCFAERGIPAMYRGKQLVIAGDNKQLQPFDLYRVRWEEEDDEAVPELEIDSLLNLANQYLPHQSLEGHYRSQALELIDFSNRHFYKGRLNMLPSKEAMNTSKPPIHFVKTDGKWENNANIIEANKVIELIIDITRSNPESEIGVVTFNATQQSLIIDLLEEKAINEDMRIPQSLFVKNIENVQGDERDIIIFTTAYAPDKNGKLQLRFGSLNQEGGENRLNVAITRARKEIYFVSSIVPGQMKVDSTKNLGPKLLKEYLQYVWDIDHGNWKPAMKPFIDHNKSWYLRTPLSELKVTGFERTSLTHDLPFADLSAKNKEEWAGLVMTDDDHFFESNSVKGPFSYLPEMLRLKKWPYVRLFSREYWLDKESTEDKLKLFLSRSTGKS